MPKVSEDAREPRRTKPGTAQGEPRAGGCWASLPGEPRAAGPGVQEAMSALSFQATPSFPGVPAASSQAPLVGLSLCREGLGAGAAPVARGEGRPRRLSWASATRTHGAAPPAAGAGVGFCSRQPTHAIPEPSSHAARPAWLSVSVPPGLGLVGGSRAGGACPGPQRRDSWKEPQRVPLGLFLGLLWGRPETVWQRTRPPTPGSGLALPRRELRLSWVSWAGGCELGAWLSLLQGRVR